MCHCHLEWSLIDAKHAASATAYITQHAGCDGVHDLCTQTVGLSTNFCRFSHRHVLQVWLYDKTTDASYLVEGLLLHMMVLVLQCKRYMSCKRMRNAHLAASTHSTGNLAHDGMHYNTVMALARAHIFG